MLFSCATGGQFEDSFRRDLYNVFTALNNMLTITSTTIIPTQVFDQLNVVFALFNIGNYYIGCPYVIDKLGLRAVGRCFAHCGRDKIGHHNVGLLAEGTAFLPSSRTIGTSQVGGGQELGLQQTVPGRW